MHCGTGVTMARDGVLAEWLRWVLLIATGSLDRPGGHAVPPRHDPAVPPRARPARGRAGDAAPRAGPSSPGCSARSRRSRWPTRSRPATSARSSSPAATRSPRSPSPTRLRAALARLDVLAVVDVAENELTALATHVLPATGQLERADVTLAEPTALRGRPPGDRGRRRAGRRPPSGLVDVRGARARRWAGRRRAASTPTCSPTSSTSRGVLGRATLDADAVFAAGPRGIELDDEPGWVHRELLPDGRWSIAPAAAPRAPRRVPSTRTGRRSCSHRGARWRGATRSRTARTRRRRWSHVAPDAVDDADRPVTLRQRPRARRRSTVRRGPHRARRRRLDDPRPDRDANPGDLTSGTDDVDPLTAMPQRRRGSRSGSRRRLLGDRRDRRQASAAATKAGSSAPHPPEFAVRQRLGLVAEALPAGVHDVEPGPAVAEVHEREQHVGRPRHVPRDVPAVPEPVRRAPLGDLAPVDLACRRRSARRCGRRAAARASRRCRDRRTPSAPSATTSTVASSTRRTRAPASSRSPG